MTELKKKSINSAKWNLLANMGQYVFTFFLSIVLSRMISPAEFGLTSMLSIFISLATLLVGSGLSTALIRDKNSTEEDFSTVFYFNILISLLLYTILFFSAPLIAKFYNQPELIDLTRWITLVFVINSFGLIQNTILVINLNFRKQTLINMSGLIISVLISIIMALNNYGVYSIVAQSLSQALIVNVLLWLTSKWRPKGIFNIQSFKKLWKFSSNILFTGLFTSLMMNIDNLIVGKIFKPNVLGLFVRAKSTRAIPEMIFVNMLNTTSFSILSKVNEDKAEFNQKHMLFFKLSAYFIIPFVVGFSACSHHIIEILYGEKWMDSVLFLKIVSFVTIPNLMAALFTQTILSFGNSSIYMKINVFKRVLNLFSIPVGIFFGIEMFILSIVIIAYIGFFIDIYFISKIIGTKRIEYCNILIKPVAFSLVMYMCLFVFQEFVDFNKLVNLFLEVTISISVYVTLLIFFDKAILNYFVEFLKSFILKKRQKGVT
jgi:teichuronic acid exporter